MERKFLKTTANKEITMFQYWVIFLFVCMPVSISAQLVDWEIKTEIYNGIEKNVFSYNQNMPYRLAGHLLSFHSQTQQRLTALYIILL